jgi:hypothetical protein
VNPGTTRGQGRRAYEREQLTYLFPTRLHQYVLAPGGCGCAKNPVMDCGATYTIGSVPVKLLYTESLTKSTKSTIVATRGAGGA